jgi:PAS domain S-box-containing protein
MGNAVNNWWLNIWSQRSVSYRGSVIVTVPSLCLILTLSSWFWTRSESLKLLNRTDQVKVRLNLSNSLLITLLNAETGVRGYLLEPNEAFLEPYNVAKSRDLEVLNQLSASVDVDSSPDRIIQQANVSNIRREVAQVQGILSELQSRQTRENQPTLLDDSKRAMDRLRAEIGKFQAQEEEALSQRSRELDRFRSIIRSIQQLALITGIISTFAAIYLFKLLEQELRSREAEVIVSTNRLKTLSDDIVDGVVILDEWGKIKTVNSAVARILRYSPLELLDQSFFKVLLEPNQPWPKPLPSITIWLEQIPRIGKVWQTPAYRKDGSSLPIELSLGEIPGERQWIAIIRDVSEQIRLIQQQKVHLEALEQFNKALVEANEALGHRNQELADFAYATAHDLRTPLRGIATLSEWIEEELNQEASETLLNNLYLMRQRTYRLNTMIEGLWEYTKLEQASFTIETVQLSDILSVVQQHNPLPEGFVLTLHNPQIQLTTCRANLQKVFEELVQNAVQHHNMGKGRIDIFAEAGETMVEFIIKDDGPGVAPAYQTRVFRLFETLGSKDETGHTGVGLAIAKKIVERVGGRIWFQSTDTENTAIEGTAIHFTWPRVSTKLNSWGKIT